MRSLFAFIMFCFSFVKGYSQNELYIHSLFDTKLYLVDLDNCTSKAIGEMPNYMYDLAMSPDGQLYGISSKNNLYLLNKANGTGEIISTYPYTLNALVYGYDGYLYASSYNGNIYKINPKDGRSISLGNCGYSSGGDLTFYEGNLYLAGASGNLVLINLINISESRPIGNVNIPSILGIITVGGTDCNGDRPKVFATGDNQIYEIDIKNARAKQVCTLPVNRIGGAASLAESSRPIRKKAGKDSTISLCYNALVKLDLNQYLRQNDSDGFWRNSNDINPITSSGILASENLPGGVYKFQYIVGNNFCADTAVITLNLKKTVEIEKIRLTSSGCYNKNGSIQVNIMDPTGFEFAINNQNFQNSNIFLNLENGRHKITVRNQTGCLLDTVVIIPSDLVPELDKIDVKNTSCGKSNGSITVIANSSNNTFSLDDISYQNSNQFNNLQHGDYTIYLKNANGCKYSKNIIINSSSAPEIISVIENGTSCNLTNGSITINASGGKGTLTFSNNGKYFTYSNIFNNLKSGYYNIVVKDSLNCMDNKPVQITSSSSPKISFIKAEPATCGMADGKLIIEADSGVAPLLYSIDNINFIPASNFDFLTSGDYEVYVKDSKNCISSQKITVKSNCINTIYIPTAFSPNDDGINDFLPIFFPDNTIKIKHFEVFNRWGTSVFNIPEGVIIKSGEKLWNGEYKNATIVTQGVYNYILSIEFNSGEIHTYRNSILVVL
ncbi:T9SS type B sorting domain-containing protein [Arsenicibacter rosenii]|uniref:Gliding motility-associated C-terminal domain-containing protein n=1 Tax=Arsenicibacter rosenii TaxID=1750698 RepID=A0A1S2VB57_9BACT|nr:gliding motility-associated C-terminal domain-containing protein [Arsenicibacter rosenii]OIN55922.1 hypothetical protein BLX24_27620 [Arsenicibacter rosenii]